MPEDFDSPFESQLLHVREGTGEILLRLANLYRRWEDAALRELDLTHAQKQLLRTLACVRPGQERRVSELAQAARLHPVLVTRLIGRFERRGLVERRADLVDRRASRILLTKTGRQLHERLIQHDLRQAGRFFKPLGERRRIFEMLLRSLLRANDPDREGPDSVLVRRGKLVRRKKDVSSTKGSSRRG